MNKFVDRTQLDEKETHIQDLKKRLVGLDHVTILYECFLDILCLFLTDERPDVLDEFIVYVENNMVSSKEKEIKRKLELLLDKLKDR